MKVKSESEVAQSCPSLCDPMDRSLPGSSTHRIFQARVLEWGVIAFSVAGVSIPILQICELRRKRLRSLPKVQQAISEDLELKAWVF